MGAQTAEYLAGKGHHVVLVEESGHLAKDTTSFDRVGLKARLKKGFDQLEVLITVHVLLAI